VELLKPRYHRTMVDNPFEWSAIAERATQARVSAEPRVVQFLPYITPAGRFCEQILKRAAGVVEKSALKTIGAYYAVQSFRSAIAATHTALSGYGDVAAGQVRTVWELQLRLARARKVGEIAALAELFVSTNREIKIRQVAMGNGGKDEERKVLDTWIAGRDELLSMAVALGEGEGRLWSLGKLDMGTMASDEGQRLEYDIWYIALSQMHHGARAFSTYSSLADLPNEGPNVLLSFDEHCEMIVASSLEYLYRALTHAALIFEDHTLALAIEMTHHSLAPLIDRLGSAARPNSP
jgi:hypothetical protein